MSNYIAHLVAKSLNTLDTVKPRVATLFEPQRMSGGLAAAPSFDVGSMTRTADEGLSELNVLLAQARVASRQLVEQSSPERTHEPIGDRSALAQRRPRRSRPPSPEEDTSSPPATVQHAPLPQHEAQPAPSFASVNAQAPTPVARRVQPAHAQPAAEQPAPITVAPAAPRQRPALTTVEETNSRVEQSRLRPQAQPEGLHQPAQMAAPAPTRASAPREEIAPSAARPENPLRRIAPQAADQLAMPTAEPPRFAQLEPAVTRIVRSALAEQMAAPSRSLRPALAERTSGERKTTPEPAPVIHVTIGRVEVRATASSAPATAQRPPSSPRMSLEDYLRQRSDGGRP